LENVAKNTILKTAAWKGLSTETAKVLSTKLIPATISKLIPKAVEASAISGASFGLWEEIGRAHV
jgi:hypothetical protein